MLIIKIDFCERKKKHMPPHTIHHTRVDYVVCVACGAPTNYCISIARERECVHANSRTILRTLRATIRRVSWLGWARSDENVCRLCCLPMIFRLIIRRATNEKKQRERQT